MALDQYTVSLLHFDDGLKDETGKVWTAKNGASVSTVQSKFGGSSLFLDHTKNQYASIPTSTDFDFGANDFTIDWWEYRTTTATNVNSVTISKQASDTGLGIALGFCYINGTTIYYYISSGSSAWDIVSGATLGSVILNQWAHYAVCRQGNKFYAFQNGVLKSTATSSLSINPNTYPLCIGNYAGDPFPGYIDEFRISKGIARWTTDFTPPTAPYEGGTPSVPAPANLVTAAGDTEVTLNWNTVTSVTGYNVKRATTAGGPYATIASNVSGTTYLDTGVVNGTTYYYVVTAITAASESGNSNEASATPQASGKVLLQIELIDGLQKEYELTKTEFDAFISWYNGRAAGTGSPYYVFNKNFNVGPFDSREDYLVFDKIQNFEVMLFTK